MKLSNKQSFGIIQYLFTEGLISHHIINSFGELFDGETKELRVIHKYGMAGKLWNNNGRIYITGYGRGEVNEIQYKAQQEEIEKYNANIEEIIKYH